MSEPTVVSTTPSGTEICYSLGVEPAAVSHACDFPPAARAQPVVTSTRGEGGAGERYDVDVGLLRDLAPDVIVTQSVCGVCAVDETLVRDHLGAAAKSVKIVSLDAASLADVYGCIREVGKALDRVERAETVVGQLRDCVGQIRRMTRDARPKPTVVVLEWLDPLRTAGNWVPDLAQAAGGRYPLVESGQRSREIDWAALRELDPDVLVCSPCSLDADATLEAVAVLRERQAWSDLTAVQTEQVYAFEGKVLSRWTPRLGGALERLAAVCHPSVVGGTPDAETLA
jgi:iron complex transport system substrate-binding protein